jgi:hypothetical protein
LGDLCSLVIGNAKKKTKGGVFLAGVGGGVLSKGSSRGGGLCQGGSWELMGSFGVFVKGGLGS